MHLPRRRSRAASVAVVAVAALALPFLHGSAASATPASREATFAAAAKEFGVPLNVLLSVSFNETRFETHHFEPSEEGGYGPMQLTDLQVTARGDQAPNTPALHTAPTAAKLIGASVKSVESDETANIRAGAALLASYGKKYNGGMLPASVSGWYTAVAAYAQASFVNDAKDFADNVYSTIRSGADVTTLDGQRVALQKAPTQVGNGNLAALGLPNAADASKASQPSTSSAPECPAVLNCGTIDTAYYLWDPNDLSNYSNYDTANRPDNSFIKFIVIHDTEETYDATTKLPPNPNYFASFHYLVKSDDGHVDQALDTKNVAWQAGNWWINTHSIGIEQEGWASRGARWFTEKLYHSTAKLVQYLAWKYQIPLDRAHIIGHDNVTGGGSNPATMHWDPGPYWDWDHFMNLVGAPLIPTATPNGNVVTIKPNFTTNKIVYSGCVPSNEPVEGGVCGTSPAQSSSWVQLRTAPSDDAPLLNDPYIHPGGVPGSNNYSDVGDTAPTGAKYVIADRSGDWTAIWFEGQEAWFKNPHNSNVIFSFTKIITPKAGVTPGVYPAPWPQDSELPADVAAWNAHHYHGPYAKYAIPAGQSYVVVDEFKTDIFYAKNYDESAAGDRTDYFGAEKYYEIWYNHRVYFVKAADFDVSYSRI